jgi:hypothetical protein
MHWRVLPLAAAMVALPALAAAQSSPIGTERRFGLGAVLGFPDIGVSLNPYLTARTSLQVDLSFAYRSDDRYGLARVDHLFWMPAIASSGWGDLRWYIGPGLYAGIPTGLYYSVRGNFRERGFFLGAEAAVGIGAAFKFPIEVMLEVAPRLQLVDDEGFFLGLSFAGALHVRYYL